MICRFCDEENKLGNSHIIPKSFFPKNSVDSMPNKLLTNAAGEHPKKAPAGIYDKTILCLSCERFFDRPDNYAKQLLLGQQEGLHNICLNNEKVGYEIWGYDYRALKLFFVSLLWRASVSTHTFYSRICIGKFEKVALDALKSDRDIPPQEFSVVLAQFDHELGQAVLLDPHPTRFDGINYNIFYIGGYIAYIKTDSRRTPSPFSELMMDPDQPLRIVSRNLLASKELGVYRSILESMPIANNHG